MRGVDCHDRLKTIRNNYSTALATVQTVIEFAGQHIDLMQNKNLDLKALKAVESQLHEIYFARFFAGFENILRHYWKSGLGKDTSPMTSVLISSIGARRHIPQGTIDVVQAIRDYRNSLVHDEHQVLRAFTIEEASPHLHVFISRLPLVW